MIAEPQPTAERLRQLSTGFAVAKEARDDDRVEHLREEIIATLHEDRAANAESRVIRPFDGIDDVSAFLTKPKEGLALRFPGFETAIPPLRSDIMLLGAMPSCGKSTMLMQLSDGAIERGWTTLIVAAEQTWRTLEAISVARLAQINSRCFTEGTAGPSVRRAIPRVLSNERLALLRERRLYTDEFPNTVRELEEIVVDAKQRVEDPRKLIVMVDGLHDMEDVEQASRREAVDSVIRKARKLARRENIPILFTVHVNQDGDPKESKGLLYKADVSILLEREDQPMAREVDALGSGYDVWRIHAIVRKNRDAETGLKAELEYHSAVREFRAREGFS